MLTGYYLNLWNKEYFFVTDYERITNKLIERIIKSLNAPLTEGNKIYLKDNLLKGKCEIKEVVYSEDFGENKAGSKRKYYNIYGKNFSGYGSFIDDGQTIIINL